MPLAALVDDRDLQAPGEEGCLAQALFERAEVEVEALEDVGVGEEGDGGAGRLSLGELVALAQRRLGDAARVLLRVQTWPSRRISTRSCSESALTTETPTPWRPPETL